MIKLLLAILLIANQVNAAPASATEVAPVNSTPVKQNPQEACVALVNSPVCQNLEKKEGLLKPEQCSTQANADGFSIMGMIGGCIKGAGMSMIDTAKFLWESVKFIATAPIKAVGGIYNYLTDGDSRASTHESIRAAMESAGDYLNSIYPYLVTEYQKAYDAVGPPWNLTETTRALKAAKDMRGNLISGLLGAAWNIVKTKYEEIGCYTHKAQAEMACKLMGDIFLPPAAFYGLIKTGINGISKMPKLTNALEDLFKKGRKTQKYVKQADEILDALEEGKKNRALRAADSADEASKGPDVAKPESLNFDKEPAPKPKTSELKGVKYDSFDEAIKANEVSFNPETKEILGATGKSPSSHRFAEVAGNIREKHGIQIFSDPEAFKKMPSANGFAGVDKNGKRFIQLNPAIFKNMDEAYGALLHETKHATNDKYFLPGPNQKVKPSNIRFTSDEDGIGITGYKSRLRSEEAEAQLISRRVMEMTDASPSDINIRSMRAKEVNLAQQEMLRKVKDRIEKTAGKNSLKHMLQAGASETPRIVTRRIEIKMNGKPVQVDIEFMMEKGVDFDQATLKTVNERLRQLEGSSALKEAPPRKAASTPEIQPKSNRADAAESTLGRKLNEDEIRGVENAHKVAPDAKVGSYSRSEIAEKAKTLKDAGFDRGERRLLLKEGIAGNAGNKTPYISFMEDGHRRAAQVLGETKDHYRIRMQGSDGQPFEKWISKDDLVGARDSDTAAMIFHRTGDSRVDDVRDAFVSGKFANGDDFISYASPSSNGRGSARVLGFNSRTGGLEIEDITRQGIVRREMSMKEFMSARKSDTARSNYDSVKGPVSTGSAEHMDRVVRQGQSKIDQHAPMMDVNGKSGSYYGNGYWRQWAGASTSDLPVQGWKLHVGASPEHAGMIAEKLAPMLREQKIPHKIVGNLEKYAKRDPRKDTQAGKFITIYPRTPKEAADIARKVDEFNRSIGLKSENFIAPPGEKRVGNGVWARYGRLKGGKLEDAKGNPIQVPQELWRYGDELLIGPNGRLEPDVRGRAAPDWVEDPF